MSRQTLLQGTLILAVAALFNRMLGVVQRIPLQNILDDGGMAYFSQAYNIYAVLLIVATAGIPTAVAKQVATHTALNQHNSAHKIYRAGLYFTVTTGILLTLLLYYLAPYYSKVTALPGSALAIQAIAPSVLLFSIISVMRGYMQGHQWMSPTSMSQIWEQVIRVGTAVLLAYFLANLGYSLEISAAGGAFGATAGGVAALTVMFYYVKQHAKKLKREPAADDATKLSYREIYRTMFRISRPIVIAAAGISVINLIDTSTVVPMLQDTLGQDAAKDQLGLLGGRAQTIAGIAPIIAIALSSAIVPAITAAFTSRQHHNVQRLTHASIRLAVISGLPIIIGLAVVAYPLNGLLFGDTDGSLVIALMSLFSLFQILMLTSTAIIQGLDRPQLPMKHVLLGITVKLAANFVLLPLMGLPGAAIATGLALAVVVVLNFISLKKLVGFSIRLKRALPLISVTAVMGVIVGLIVLLGEALVPLPHTRLFQLVIVAFSSLIGGSLYFFGIAKLNILQEEEIRRFPRIFQVAYRKYAAKKEIGL